MFILTFQSMMGGRKQRQKLVHGQRPVFILTFQSMMGGGGGGRENKDKNLFMDKDLCSF